MGYDDEVGGCVWDKRLTGHVAIVGDVGKASRRQQPDQIGVEERSLGRAVDLH
jgi:hypothetical protein